VLRQLPAVTHPDLLVGVSTEDDAAVYRITDDLALVQTVDFFPPIVDDPYAFGEIAVANALSDIYAMGARPLLALNIVGFPANLPKEVLGEILKGGASKAVEAGVLIVGGHTVDDKEPKYGMAVTGVIRPGMQVTNAGARLGDVLLLTKPIGTGIITTAAMRDEASPEVLAGAVEMMRTLNHAASDAMIESGVNACVDVTGFGLIGHLIGMLKASGHAARIGLGQVPLLKGAGDLVARGVAPGGTRRNLSSAERHVKWDPAIEKWAKLLLCDAQTSGGLLISVPRDRLDRLVAELRSRDVETVAAIGEVLPEDSLDGRLIEVVP
jgi:selenide,water dikinase